MDPAFEATRSAADGYPGCPYRQILVGWDASADAAAALRAAVGIGGPGGRVVALAALPEAASIEEHGADGPADALAATETFERAKANLSLSSGARVSLHVRRGPHAAEMICRYAAEHGFDLIVLGRHGDGGLLPHRLGRVAEAAARTSRIPVLLLGSP